MLDLVFRNIANRKGRTLLTILGITIGVMAIVILVAMADGLEGEVTQGLQRLHSVQVFKRGALFPENSRLSLSDMATLERIEGVRVVSPRVQRALNSVENAKYNLGGAFVGGEFPPQLTGIDPDTDSQSPYFTANRVTLGRGLLPGERGSIVVGKKVATDFQKRVGNLIEAEGRTFRIVGISDTGSDLFDNRIVVQLDVAQDMAGLDRQSVNLFLVDVRDPSEAERVAKRIELKMPHLEARSPRETTAQLSEILSTVRTGAFAITAIAAIVGGIGVANTMLMNVLERRREIGVLKAVGWTNREVMRTILTESILVSLLGGLLGVALGTAILHGIHAIRPSLAYLLTPLLVAQVLAFATLLGILGGAYPAWSTTRIQPAEALRYE
ncbi:MAG: ABC transporter permease [Euryarchaeota archaeon]|nr:ABC transporter permease [Euryarchaeota archaeon]